MVICDGEICLIHKPGGCPLKSEQLQSCLNKSIARERTIRNLMEMALQKK